LALSRPPELSRGVTRRRKGPSHLIGFALDGFPIHGGRDLNGNTIPVSKLDACNGITSATPEFPTGIYQYVLPIGVTGKRSSLNCYAGTHHATADGSGAYDDVLGAGAGRETTKGGVTQPSVRPQSRGGRRRRSDD
jgi:hypothetical protein